MTIKEAILKTLEDNKKLLTHKEVYEYIVEKKYYSFDKGKTPEATISAQLGEFIRNEDNRIKRTKGNGRTYLYYLTKYEDVIDIESITLPLDNKIKPISNSKKIYQERDLHLLVSSYLKNQNIFSKTIFHEQSKSNNDNHQKWIHPDMLGIKFLNLTSTINQAFMKEVNKTDTFKITSYEIKREINTDYELKKSYFQAVSNSSWANYGYLVAFDINKSLMEEMERLNQSFGIGIIELHGNPYKSKIIFQSRYQELDFRTIDKLCKVNKEFEKFIEFVEKYLTASEKYMNSTEKEFEEFCDNYFNNDSDIEEYCKNKLIPIDNNFL